MGRDGWKTFQLGDLIQIKHGFAFKGDCFCDESTRDVLLTPGNFAAGGGFKDDKLKYYRGPVPEDFVLTPGDLIVTMTDLSKAADTLGFPAIVPQNAATRRYLHNQRLGLISIIKPDALEPRFLYYLMCTRAYRHHVLAGATGTTVKHTSPTKIRDYAATIPPFPIQQRIADVLGTLDDKIELNRRMNRTLEKMAAAIFKSWFIDFDPVHAKAQGRDPNLPAEIADLFPDSFEDSDLGPIPKGWAVSKLGDLIELAYGKSLRAQDRRPGPVAVYGSNGRVGWYDTVLVPGPGIVVGRKGNPGIVTWSPAEFFPIDTTFYVVPIESIRSVYFLFHALKNHNLASLGADSAVPGLNRNMAYMSQQIVPTSELVNVFDSFAKPVCDRIYVNERQNRRLAGLRDTLLPKLLSGEIELPEAEAIAEGVSS